MGRRFVVQDEEKGGDAGGGAGGAPQGDQGFHTMLQNPELRSWAQQRGWKDPDSVVESFRNAEKLLGAPKDRVMVLPDSPDSPDWAAVHTRLGRPEAPEKYEFELAGAYDEAFLNGFRQTAFEAGLPASAASKVAKWWESYVDGIVAEQERTAQEATEAELGKLRAEWGARFEESSKAAESAAGKVGLSPDQWKAIEGAIGPMAARKAFGLIASRVLEGGPPLKDDGGGSGFGGTPEAARMMLDQLEGDTAFMAKYLGGDRAALKRMSDLRAAAYPDEA